MNELDFDELSEMHDHNESADTIISQASRQDGIINLTQNSDFHNETITGNHLEERRYKQIKAKGKRNRINHEIYTPDNVEEF